MRKPLVIANSGLIEERARGDSLLAPFSFFDHFVGNLNNVFGTATTGAGSGTTANVDALQGQVGIIRVRAGNGGTAGALLHTGANTLRFSNAYGLRFIAGAGFPVLSTSTVRYVFRAGLKVNPQNFGDGTGIYIRYSDTINGGNFQGVVRNGGTESTLDFSVGPTANTPFTVGFEVETDFSSVTFFAIDQQGNYLPQGSLLLSGAFVPAIGTIVGGHISLQKGVGSDTRDCYADFILIEVF